MKDGWTKARGLVYETEIKLKAIDFAEQSNSSMAACHLLLNVHAQ